MATKQEQKDKRVFLGFARRIGYDDVMRLKYAVYDGNLCVGYFVDSYVASLILHVGRVGEEEKVATVEGRFHRATGEPVKETTPWVE